MMNMQMVYLDYNCFQRGFDDPGQVKIQMETLGMRGNLCEGGEKGHSAHLVIYA